MAATAAESYAWAKRRTRAAEGAAALLGEAAATAAAAMAAAATFEGEAQLSFRLSRPSGTAAAGCGGCKARRGVTRGRAEASWHEVAGQEARDWAGRGQGLRLGARASRSQRERAGQAGWA